MWSISKLSNESFPRNMNGLEAMSKRSSKGKWDMEIYLQNPLECPVSHP